MTLDFARGHHGRMILRKEGVVSGKGKMNRLYVDLTSGGIFSCMFGPFWPKFHKALHARPVHLYSTRFPEHYWLQRYKEALRELTGYTSFVVYTSGTEAVEAFLRVAWAYTGKSGVWGGLVDPDMVGSDKPICDQFHGWTLGSRILAGRMTWHELGVYPELGMGRFGTQTQGTACMAMEPYHAPSGQFHKVDPTINRIVSLRKEYPDILFLIDEIQGGFGRTGKLFAHQHYTDSNGNFLLNPDFVTIGKLAGAGFPLAVLCGPSEIMDSKTVQEHAYLHSTHSGNPLTCKVGCVVIEEMIKQDIIGRSHRLGAYMHEQLQKLPVRVHGKGMMAGLEFQDTDEATKVVRKCEEKRVLVVETGRKWVKIGPCLSINQRDLEYGLKVLWEVVNEVVSEREITGKKGIIRTKTKEGNAETCSTPGPGPELGSPGVEIPRFQVGVERIAEGSEDAGQQEPDSGVSTG
jgi:acetylornithine/succinyldiaminopimelate/putrescine aminotransferase